MQIRIGRDRRGALFEEKMFPNGSPQLEAKVQSTASFVEKMQKD